MKWSWVFNCSLDYSLYFPDWKFLLIKRTEERKYFHAVLFYYVPILIPQVGKPHFNCILKKWLMETWMSIYCLQFEKIKSFTSMLLLFFCFLKSAIDRQQKCLGRRNNDSHIGFKEVNVCRLVIQWQRGLMILSHTTTSPKKSRSYLG